MTAKLFLIRTIFAMLAVLSKIGEAGNLKKEYPIPERLPQLPTSHPVVEFGKCAN